MTKEINIKVDKKNISFPKGTTFEQVAAFCGNEDKKWLVAKSGNCLFELTMPVENGMEIEFFDITNIEGMRVYSRGVSMLMIKAVKDIYGADTPVMIEHSINNNYYCEIRMPNFQITPSVLEKISQRMQEIVAMDVVIEKIIMPKDEAIEIAMNNDMYDKARLFRYGRVSNINLYKMDGFWDCFYGDMVPSTGYLTKFDLVPFENGFLIRFPNKVNTKGYAEYASFDKVSSVFMEQMDWCGLMKVENVADLDDLIVNGDFEQLVLINEALHEKKIAQIADTITANKGKLKLVLIAGPSSSGKTTFAQRLCIQLRVNGVIPHTIGLDDYFIDRGKTPVDEFGKPNFESIDALDLHQFNKDLSALINGEKVEIPSYNFVQGKREYKGRFLQLAKDDIVVVEGIHGLNDMLTEEIDDENKFRIFISAMTQLNVDDHNRISTSDSRLIRRIVRDHQFRGNDATKTIATWPSVKRGEEENIFPFQENADIMFNSATIYELSILKVYIEPLLYKIDKSCPEYITANRIIKFLDYFIAVNSSCVPNNSIIKEFVGGSVFKV